MVVGAEEAIYVSNDRAPPKLGVSAYVRRRVAGGVVDLAPVTLKGRWLTLEPIDEHHVPGLFAAMRDDEVCRYLAWDPPRSIDDTLVLVREAKDAMARGQSIVYAQVWNATGQAIGSTRLLDVRPADRQVEI